MTLAARGESTERDSKNLIGTVHNEKWCRSADTFVVRREQDTQNIVYIHKS